MRIAVVANFRTTFMAMSNENPIDKAFTTAYKAGCVMGFGMVSLSLLVLVS